MSTLRPDVDLLLRHQEWVRTLAHRLVADPATADDVAQETLIAAATRAPAGLREPRGWLRTVAQNAARAFARSTQRRLRREQLAEPSAAAIGDATDPAVTLQRAAAHKRVVDALFALPEPYHTVLVLRFFDDLAMEAIAERLARPVATVRSQLQRGLQRLREVLDGECGGDRAAWCSALAPLLVGRTTSAAAVATATLGGLAMFKWITTAVGLLLALSLVWLLVPPAAPAAPISSTSNAAAAVASADASAPANTSERLEAAPPTPTTEPSAAPTSGRLRGRLLDPDGSAMVGLTVAWADPSKPRRVGNRIVVRNLSVDLDHPGNKALLATPAGRRQLAQSFGGDADAALAAIEGRREARSRATTDGVGRFDLAIDGPGALELESTEHLVLGKGQLPDEPDPIHVVCRATAVGGIVRDASGSPLAGVHVTMGLQLGGLPGIAPRLRGSDEFRSWNATSRADGTFALGLVPVHPALSITAQKRGFAALSTPTTTIAGPVDWTLASDARQTPTLTGTVRHADGRPGAGARVDFGQDAGTCDEHGRFSFALTYWSEGTQLTAWVAGHEAAVLDGLGARLRTDANAGRDLQLWLGGPAKTITGRVLAADGSPLRLVQVAVVDGVPAGTSDQTIESLVGEQKLAVTDDDGRFELRGLSARPYHVRAVMPNSLLVLEARDIAAGTQGLALQAAADAFVPRCEGIVVDGRGQPVAGAEVRLRAVLRRSDTFVKALPSDARVTTDAKGRFVWTNCPRRGVQWTIEGDGLAWTTDDSPTDAGPVRLVVARRLTFRLLRTSDAGPPPTAFEVRDAAGAVLTTTERRPGVQSMHHRVPLRDTAAYEVDDRAATLVLFAGDQELRQLPLQLRIDGVTDVGF